MIKHVFFVALLATIAASPEVRAQNVEPQRLEVTVEAERLHYTYHFTNPAPFDTAAPVPHFFEQDYRVDTMWLLGEAHYMAGIPWRTIAGATPPRPATAAHSDTFFIPDGTVIVSGTTGEARTHAFRASQEGQIARVDAVAISVGYRFRVDFVAFGAGDKSATRNGVPEPAFDLRTPATTSSEVHEVLVTIAAERRVAGRWHVLFDGDAAPVGVARLNVGPPVNRAGGERGYSTRLLSTNARIRAVRVGSVPFEVVLDAGEMWSYREDDRLALGRIAFGVSFGLP